MLADPLGDALDLAGDVAAFDRQRAAVSGDRADRIFGNFFDAERGHCTQFPTNNVGHGLPGKC